MAPDREPARRQRVRSRHGLGAAHPVAAQAVEVVGISGALAPRPVDGAGQGAAAHIGIGLVAEEIVWMQVQVQHQPHRGGRDRCNRLALLLAIQPRRAGVDDHHAVAGVDKRRIDDVAAVAGREVGIGAFQQPHARGDLARGQAIVRRLQRSLLGECRRHGLARQA
jgi:hypothetical protein